MSSLDLDFVSFFSIELFYFLHFTDCLVKVNICFIARKSNLNPGNQDFGCGLNNLAGNRFENSHFYLLKTVKELAMKSNVN